MTWKQDTIDELQDTLDSLPEIQGRRILNKLTLDDLVSLQSAIDKAIQEAAVEAIQEAAVETIRNFRGCV